MYLYVLLFLVVIFLFFPKRQNGEQLKKLLKQSAKYATMAQQDGSPLISTLHANYAMGYFLALKDISTPKDVKRFTGVDMDEYETHMTAIRDMATRKVIDRCPQITGDVNNYIAQIAGDDYPGYH
jgi:hypothetical protein